MERKDLELRLAVAEELERRRRAAPLLYYAGMLKDHPKQRKFHDLGRAHRRRLFLGGNRSGKTTAGAHEALAYVYGYRFWEVPGLRLGPDGDLPPRDSISPDYWVRRPDGIPVRVPGQGMVVTGLPRARGIGHTIYPKLFDSLPEALRSKRLPYRAVHGALGIAEWCEFPNGARILFASEEQDNNTFEGFTLDWAWVDEPCRLSIYKALWARLFDFMGALWFTQTPLGAKAAWLLPWVNATPDDVGLVEVHMQDNPANTKEKIRQFIESGEFSENELQARLYGRFEVLGGRAVDNFEPAVHVVPGFVPPKEWIHGCAVDPHHKRPAAVLYFAFDPSRGIYYFYRQRPASDGAFHKIRQGSLTPVELATILRNAEGNLLPRVRIVDPRFGPAEHVRHGFRETCFVELMREQGLEFDSRVPNTASIEYGLERLKALLHYDKSAPVSPSNTPHLFVTEDCPDLINSFTRCGYIDSDEPTKGGQRKLSEEYKDFLDCARYAVLYPLPCTAVQINRLQRITPEELADANAV